MKYHIDKSIKIGGAFIVHGWSDSFSPGDSITLLSNHSHLETITKPVTRQDLSHHFGKGAERWGFRVFGVEDASFPVCSTSLGIRFANGDLISSISSASVPVQDRLAHMVWANFVAEVNLKGGSLIEIGSRARSGLTRRNQFGEGVRYIGVDISEGANVDIVADAHALAQHIQGKVDYVCSISTFEHFILPWKVVLEMNKVLPVGGRVFTQSHQTWPEHDVPFDYFRFSGSAWSGLFNAHTGFRVIETNVSHPVAVTAFYNMGGPFEEMDSSVGYAMSVCVAEKVSEPMVSWDAPASLIYDACYTY